MRHLSFGNTSVTIMENKHRNLKYPESRSSTLSIKDFSLGLRVRCLCFRNTVPRATIRPRHMQMYLSLRWLQSIVWSHASFGSILILASPSITVSVLYYEINLKNLIYWTIQNWKRCSYLTQELIKIQTEIKTRHETEYFIPISSLTETKTKSQKNQKKQKEKKNK